MNLDFLKPLGDAIGGILSSPAFLLGVQAIAVYVVILWLATAYWAFRDMQMRTGNPVLPYFAAALIIGFTPLLFVFAVFVYKIIRPQERLADAYERGLAQEALVAEIEAIEHCPTCSRKINDEWIICPTCRSRLKRVCPNCSRLVGPDWSICAWCGRDFERREGTVAIGAVPAPRYVEPEPTAPSLGSPAPAPVAEPLPVAATPRPRAARSVGGAGTARTTPRS